jgi:hypothetical protein
MGITSLAFSQSAFSVTGPNESYLFGSAPSGSGTTGNLVYATDSTGTTNAHQWYVGGFSQAKNAYKAQITSAGLQMGTSAKVLNSSGNPILQQTGSILQVVSTTVTAKVTTTVSSTSTFYAISGLAATITPTSSTSKIYAMVQLVGSGTGGYNIVCAFQLCRAGSPVGQGDAASGFRQASVGNTRASLDGNSDYSIGWNYLDSPATTSAVTYQIAGTCESGNLVLNTTANDSTGIYSSRSASSITLFEVAA